MKENYEQLDMEVVVFNEADVLTASLEDGGLPAVADEK